MLGCKISIPSSTLSSSLSSSIQYWNGNGTLKRKCCIQKLWNTLRFLTFLLSFSTSSTLNNILKNYEKVYNQRNFQISPNQFALLVDGTTWKESGKLVAQHEILLQALWQTNIYNYFSCSNSFEFPTWSSQIVLEFVILSELLCRA